MGIEIVTITITIVITVVILVVAVITTSSSFFCSRYNHFVPSSSLITGTSACRPIDMFPGALDVPTTSPTSGHLSIILNLIAKSYNEHTPEQTLLLLSMWMQEICLQSENYIGILSKTTEYQQVLKSLVACGANIDRDISIAVCELFEMMLSAKNVIWGEEVYFRIVDLGILHLTSREEILREKYGSLLTRVPLNIVIPKLNTEHLISETKVSRRKGSNSNNVDEDNTVSLDLTKIDVSIYRDIRKLKITRQSH